jgi:hypothetical protein
MSTPTTLSDLNTIAGICGAGATVLSIILAFVLIPFFRKMSKFTKGWDSFLRDWNGTPAEPGRDATPGVMERLNNIDGEFKNNHGSTMKDDLGKLQKTLDSQVLPHLKTMDGRIDAIDARTSGQPYPKKASTAA